jgi:hypothetical protein
MAVTNLTALFQLVGGGRIESELDLSVPADSLSLGSSRWPAISTALTYGDGSGQANMWYHAKRTAAAETTDAFSLVGSVTGPLTGSGGFAAVKFLLLSIESPNGSKTLQVGPRGEWNGWHPPWVDGNAYEHVYDVLLKTNRWSGWPVFTGGAGDVLYVRNPTLSPITYRVLVIGVSPAS